MLLDVTTHKRLHDIFGAGVVALEIMGSAAFLDFESVNKDAHKAHTALRPLPSGMNALAQRLSGALISPQTVHARLCAELGATQAPMTPAMVLLLTLVCEMLFQNERFDTMLLRLQAEKVLTLIAPSDATRQIVETYHRLATGTFLCPYSSNLVSNFLTV